MKKLAIFILLTLNSALAFSQEVDDEVLARETRLEEDLEDFFGLDVLIIIEDESLTVLDTQARGATSARYTLPFVLLLVEQYGDKYGLDGEFELTYEWETGKYSLDGSQVTLDDAWVAHYFSLGRRERADKINALVNAIERSAQDLQRDIQKLRDQGPSNIRP